MLTLANAVHLFIAWQLRTSINQSITVGGGGGGGGGAEGICCLGCAGSRVYLPPPPPFWVSVRPSISPPSQAVLLR